MFSIQTDRTLDRWIEGFDRLEKECADAPEHFGAARDAMFVRCDEVVHVVSGRLALSGKAPAPEGRDGRIEAEVVFGAPYANIERKRGGEHDFIMRGFVPTVHEFEHSLAETWEDVAGGWGGA